MMDYQKTTVRCPKCDSHLYWRDCDRCNGTGHRHHDITAETCKWCEGERGTWRCEVCHRFIDSETVKR